MTQRWGIIGTSAVAQQFGAALAKMGGGRCRAVTSANSANAEAFARAHGFLQACPDLNVLLADDQVDVVYIASPTALHHDHALAALAAGKSILCEKPFTGSAVEAATVVATARKAGLFCMEAMWLRFSVIVEELRGALADDRLGAISGATMSIGYPRNARPGRPGDVSAMRVFGCYGLSLARFLFGPPRDMQAVVGRDAHGVDRNVAVTLDYGSFAMTIDASTAGDRANRFEVFGTQATAVIPAPVIDPVMLNILPAGHGGGQSLKQAVATPIRMRLPSARARRGSGLYRQIGEVEACIAALQQESKIMPLDETLAVWRMMEHILVAPASSRWAEDRAITK